MLFRSNLRIGTTLEMTSNALTKSGKVCYVKHCKCTEPKIHKRFSLLIGLNDCVQYDI